MHPRYRAGFLIYSYYCLLYALLFCSASLARKFRPAAVLAFSALRILSSEVLRVRERASTHPTHCLRTFRSTVRPTCKEEREVRTNTYVRGRNKSDHSMLHRALSLTPFYGFWSVQIYVYDFPWSRFYLLFGEVTIFLQLPFGYLACLTSPDEVADISSKLT